ncbi:type II toxin-antitoxin system RelB family antitoxin [Pseudomonas sp. LT1P18]|uniref:type II toxin-antitoxin system RelB family antitoxin n=1 Tax=Pseudomonas arabinosi TaxID=3398357 RepID=UPI0039EF4AFE
MTSIQLDPETERRLGFLAESTGRTRESCLQEIIDYGLTEMEDYYLATEVLERVRSDEESVHSTADVRKDLGVDD